MIPAVSIVIPTWNGLDLLKRFLPSVTAAATRYSEQGHAHTEIIIVDDGSVDETVDWLRSRGFSDAEAGEADGLPGPRGVSGEPPNQPPANQIPAPALRFVRNKTNRGFGEACNRGFITASNPLVFLLNNDVEVDAGSIAPLVENFASASVFAAHCRVFDLESGRECGTGKVGGFARGFIRVHRSYVPGATNAGERRAELYSMFAGGGSAMFDREKFLEIGGFEPLLAPFYWEDVELSYRAWKRGYRILYEPRSVARHRVSSTIGKLNKRAVRKIEQQNRLIYHWIHLHDRRMMISHALWAMLLALTGPLRMKPEFTSGCAGALKLLPRIRRRRIEEMQAARRTDRDVFRIFAELEKREDVLAYDGLPELEIARRSNA